MTDTNKRIDNLLENFDKGYVSYKEAKAEILQLIREARLNEIENHRDLRYKADLYSGIMDKYETDRIKELKEY